MAKVATRGPIIPPSNSHLFSDGASAGGSLRSTGATKTKTKRKTPSELRAEQLNGRKFVEKMDESPASEPGSIRNANGVTSGPFIKPKNPRYVDTRVDELFPSRKNSMRLKMLPVKETAKEKIDVDHTDSLNNSSTSVKIASDRPNNDAHASTAATQSHITLRKCNVSTFRSVVELLAGGDKSSDFSFNMDEAFKGLAARPPLNSSIAPDGKTNSTSANFCSEFDISGHKVPLDFTLKTSMRVVASSSVNWFHRMMSCGTFNGSTGQISNAKALYSWVYPQSSLPPSVITALTSTSEGEGQMDFLTKRQLAWETSFRSLYIMLRKNICSLFYVCTGQFVAMFTNINGSTGSKPVCSAYVSQSTRNLRSLLKEQDISFTMPLCHSKVEQVTTEDLLELSEIEKHNLGKTRRTVSLSDVDNSPESLLVFSDNNVHGLYEFLLNYRFLLPSLNTLDVPLLYSPVPFENAAVSAPEVKCKEVRKIDHMSGLTTIQPNHDSSSTSHYTIEIKDTYLPPWITSCVCDAIRSNGDSSFEASFVTEPISVGLNVGLDVVSYKLEGLQELSCPFGVKDTVVSHHLSRGFLKGLKYCNDSYAVSLSPV
ncbi:uncharacterized protein LOC143627903 [Bidens hawaiensis]|uniref:uncharacterized protein LOC143627903 n=1 Tax=Bidens hawaiensis TaxID=980011 RepID=UPI004049A464